MRKKDLRVVRKPSAKLNCELLDSGSEAGMTKNKKDTGIHKKGSPKADSESGRSSISSFPRRRESGKGDESGRSMVETLGVLAIMGLLAVGGIMAYRYAVTKYQANETFNELRRRVVVHSQQSIIGTPLSQVEMGDTTQLGYPIAVARVDSGFFELTLQDIDNNLCREMVRTGWTLPTQTRVNGVVVGTNPETCGEENSLVFRFQTEMGGCKADEDCPCGTCANGVCQTTCGSGESCVKDFNDGQYVCCPGESVKGRFCCETVNEAGECCDADGNCCPPEKPLIDGQGRCHDCDETTRFTGITKEACHRCANREFYTAYTDFCAIPCPAETPIMGSPGCYTCDEDISWGSSWLTKESDLNQICRSCPGRTVTHEVVNRCRKCEIDDKSFPVKNKADCDRCPGRIYFGTGYGYHCAWPCKNPADIMSSVGKCYACDVPETIDTRGVQPDGTLMHRDGGECQKCWGKRFLGAKNPYEGDPGKGDPNWSTVCYHCDSDIQYVYLGSYAGSDYPAMCEACGNRRSFNHYCAKYCEDEKIWDNRGKCHTCDEEADFNVQGVPENKCACPGERYLDGNMCKKCPEDVSALTPAQQAQCGVNDTGN